MCDVLLDGDPAFDDQLPLVRIEGRRHDVELLEQLLGVDLGRVARAALRRRAFRIGRVRARRVAAASAEIDRKYGKCPGANQAKLTNPILN